MKTIDVTNVMRYVAREGKVLTSLSKCEVSEVRLMHDLAEAIQTHDGLTQAIINMKEKLGIPVDNQS